MALRATTVSRTGANLIPRTKQSKRGTGGQNRVKSKNLRGTVQRYPECEGGTALLAGEAGEGLPLSWASGDVPGAGHEEDAETGWVPAYGGWKAVEGGKIMLNHITIMGRLTRDPELQRTGTGIAVANFSVAVERDFKDSSGEKKVDFINCVAWRQTGEFVSKYFTKGAMIVVSGRLEMRNWTDSSGNKRVSAEINAERCYFGGSKRDSDGGSAYGGGGSYGGSGNGYSIPGSSCCGYVAPDSNSASDYALLEDDDGQLPF